MHVLVLWEHLVFELEDIVETELVFDPGCEEALLDEQVEDAGHRLEVLWGDMEVA